jgi:hypothetical protein
MQTIENPVIGNPTIAPAIGSTGFNSYMNGAFAYEAELNPNVGWLPIARKFGAKLTPVRVGAALATIGANPRARAKATANIRFI